MGTTNNYKETNIGQALIRRKCSQCDKQFTDKDILDNNNWDVEFDTSNDVNLEDNKIKGYGYNLTIWLRNAYHADCDEAKEQEAKVNWKELGENIKNSHPLDNLQEVQRRQVEKMKKDNERK